MSEKTWKDPVVEEVRKIRHELDKEFKKDPKGFMERARKAAIKAGFKFAPSLSSLQRKKTATSRK